jgi:hypothetical protein
MHAGLERHSHSDDTEIPGAWMNGQPNLLKLARERRGWSQEQAIVRFENLSRVMGVRFPARASLRTLLSLFENNRRIVPSHYQSIFRELYRATDEDLGFSASGAQKWLPVPPALPADLPETASPEILSYLANILTEHVMADTVIGPRYLIPAVQSQLPLIDRLCQVTRGPDRRDVLAIAARFAQFCGWLYQDSGNPESAGFWTNAALDYAQELNDPQTISYIMMRRSNIATESGSPGHGLGLANAALNAYDVLTPRMRAVSLRQRANAHALLLEQREFEESIDLALIQAADGASQATPELCDIERSCLVGAEALTIARSTGSARIRSELHALYNELAPHVSDVVDRKSVV